MYEDNLRTKQDILNPIEFTEINIMNILHYHQYTKAPYKKLFQRAIFKEVNAHVERKTWSYFKENSLQNKNKSSHPYGH